MREKAREVPSDIPATGVPSSSWKHRHDLDRERLDTLCRAIRGNKGEKSYDSCSRGNARGWWLGLRAVQGRV